MNFWDFYFSIRYFYSDSSEEECDFIFSSFRRFFLRASFSFCTSPTGRRPKINGWLCFKFWNSTLLFACTNLALAKHLFKITDFRKEWNRKMIRNVIIRLAKNDVKKYEPKNFILDASVISFLLMLVLPTKWKIINNQL